MKTSGEPRSYGDQPSVLSQVLATGGFAGVGLFPRDDGLYAMLVVGDSMNGAGIEDRDIVLLASREPQPGEIVAAELDGGRTLKRYVVEGDRHLLRAANHQYPDIPLLGKPRALGTVVGILRDYSVSKARQSIQA